MKRLCVGWISTTPPPLPRPPPRVALCRALERRTQLARLARPGDITESVDLKTRQFLRRLNNRHADRFTGDTELAARIASHELAARMQLAVPEVADLSDEPAHILDLYGATSDGTKVGDLRAAYARNCILARRLCERGYPARARRCAPPAAPVA